MNRNRPIQHGVRLTGIGLSFVEFRSSIEKYCDIVGGSFGGGGLTQQRYKFFGM